MQDYEKLGAFYLGREVDSTRGETGDELVLYDSKDLTTHAVCVGMTGSGKTGLCVTLLEEAAIDGIPVIAIDPKGDLGNLLLTFPQLRAIDFAPWIDPNAATRSGQTIEAQAKKTAELWRKGLAEWHQDGERIARLKSSADFCVYTPGSSTGMPLALLRSFDAPSAEVAGDAEAMRDRVESAVSGLLALLGIPADPIRSREHILLANILDHAWRAGRNLDIAAMIGEIQNPPFERVGVLDLDSFYSAGDRFELAMTLNNLLASPGFAAWMEGEPLDIGNLLYTADGRPRVSILSISHLSDSARMFFVTILLNEIVSWMRSQSGTTSLRAILYMDEVFGYFPPTAAPPSKKPMLTLLKQARAFGLGVVLATQNPVDLDYKGLANAGTWLIGRLQTERDKQKVIEGLEGAAGAHGTIFDRKRTEQILAGLGQRTFLMNNVHEDQPVLFQTRWALSYLRGPLTRAQIQLLTAERKAATTPAQASEAVAPTPLRVTTGGEQSNKPVLPPDVPQVHLDLVGQLSTAARLVYRPAIVATTKLHFVSSRTKVDEWRDVSHLVSLDADQADLDWDEAAALSAEPTFGKTGQPGASYAALPSFADDPKRYPRWRKALVSHLYRNEHITVWRAAAVDEVSHVGESERDFRIRLSGIAREHRDLAVEKLRAKYAPRLQTIQDRIRRAEDRIEREQAQASQKKMQAAISIGATVLGALFRRRRSGIGRATTALRGASRAASEYDDVVRARNELAEQEQRFADLQGEFDQATRELEISMATNEIELEPIEIKPRKSDIIVERVALAWTPWAVDEDGIAEPRYVE